jgi:phosphopantetheinyl transferase
LTRLFACPGELPPDKDDPLGQTRLWAVKEAVLKLLGLVRRWRLRGGQLLGGAFQRELRRRGLVVPAP